MKNVILLMPVWTYVCAVVQTETIFFSLWDTGFQKQWLICSQKCLGLSIKYRNTVDQGPLSSSCIVLISDPDIQSFGLEVGTDI